MSQQASKEPRYPFMAHLMTRGTYYDVGYNVGLAFSQPTRLYFAESDNFRNNLLRFYDSQAGRDFYEESLRACQDCYPQYVREIRGMSDGAGLPFEHIFLENISSEINAILRAQTEAENPQAEPASNSAVSQTTPNHATKETEGKTSCVQSSKVPSDSVSQASSFPDNIGCTDLLINRPGHQLMLHNEDSYPLVKRYGYLLSAEIEEDGEEGLQKEQFTSFCCPGSLPGWTASYNVHGLAMTKDWLCPKRVVRETPGRVFVCRALMKARDIEEAATIAKNAPRGVAYGFCANISSKEGRMVSMEVGPGKPEGLIHVHDVTHQKNPDAPCHYYHFNAYKHLTKQVAEFDNNWSSIHRAKRVAELPPPRTRQQALTVLADTHDQKRPIFRTPRPTDQCETVNTIVLDIVARQMLVYQGREDMLRDSPLVNLAMYK